MYAVFVDGSRQYKVSEGEVVKVDFRRAAGEHPLDGVESGTAVEFKRVLLYQNGDDTRIGQPVVEGVRILGEVVDHPSTKVYVQHFRRRKNYRRLRGHRQRYTAVRVKHILLPGQEPSSASMPAAAPSEPVTAPPSETQPTQNILPPGQEPSVAPPPAAPSEPVTTPPTEPQPTPPPS